MKKDLKMLFKSPNLWVTIIGISLVPALYALVFLSSMWNPYGNLDKLPVAVVNQDKSAIFQNKTINVGDKMVDSMSESKNLDFHFTSQQKAQEGLKNGKYYMIITLPKNLSKKAVTILSNHPEKATIHYQTSKGHNFTSSKMGQSAMTKLESKVSKKITKTYNQELFSNLKTLKKGMGQAANGSKKLSDGSNKLKDGSQQISDNLNVLSSSTGTLSSGASTLNSGINQYTNGVSTLGAGISTLSSGLNTYTSGVNQLASGANTLNSNSQQLVSGAAQLKNSSQNIQKLVDGANSLTAGLQKLQNATTVSQEKSAQMQALTTGLPQLQAGINQLNTAVSNMSTGSQTSIDTSSIQSNLTDIVTKAKTISEAAAADKTSTLQAVQSTAAYAAMTSDQQAEISNAVTNSPSTVATNAQAIIADAQSMGQTLSALSTAAGQLQSAAGQLNMLKSSVAQINTAANQALPGATTAITELSSGVSSVNSALSSQIIPGSQQVAQGVTTVQSQLTYGGTQLYNGITAYTNGVSTLTSGANKLASNSSQITTGTAKLIDGSNQLTSKNTQLNDGASQLANGAAKLSDGAGKLAVGADTLNSGVGSLSTGATTLAEKLAYADKSLNTVSFKKDNATNLSSPIKIAHKDNDNVKTNGVGMAPYMISVSLIVAALSTNIIFADSLSGLPLKNRKEWAKSKLLTNGMISTLASIVLFTTILLMGINPNYPLRTFLMILLMAWTAMGVVTALLGWDRRFGSFASLIFLLLQLGSSAGTYPLEIIPHFFKKISHFLPMYYSVSGLRQTISLTGNIRSQAGMLVLFTIGAMIIGYFIYREPKTIKTRHDKLAKSN